MSTLRLPKVIVRPIYGTIAYFKQAGYGQSLRT